MSAPLGTIPPRDPQREQQQREAGRDRAGNGVLALLLAVVQALLAAALGYWAAGAWPGAGDALVSQAAAGMLLVLMLAHVVAYGAMLVLGSVALLAMLPRLFRPMRTTPAARSRRTSLADRLALATIVIVHGMALVAGALLLCLLLAFGSEAAGIGAWWRFVLAALALVPLTLALLLAWSRSDL